MKALVLHGPGNVKYEENWPKPRSKKGWALVRVKYSGICGSDLPRMMITGAYHHPLICGHEFTGCIESTVPGTDKFKSGDTVAVSPLIPCMKCSACLEKKYFQCRSYSFLGSRTDGGFAEYCLVPEENLFRIPENIDERIGAFFEPISVALHLVRSSEFKKGNRALVFGAGTIGLLTAMWLKIFEAKEVVVADVREESLQIAQTVGFKNAFNVNDKKFKAHANFDYCFEAAGSNAALLQAIEKTRAQGVVTVLGRSTQDTVIPLEKFEDFLRKEVILKGCWGYNNVDEETLIYDTLKEGKFDIAPLITMEAPLNEGTNVINRMFKKNMFYCKVLLKGF